MNAVSADIDPSCAICGAPPFPECPHESERMELALNQAQARWAGMMEIRYVPDPICNMLAFARHVTRPHADPAVLVAENGSSSTPGTRSWWPSISSANCAIRRTSTTSNLYPVLPFTIATTANRPFSQPSCIFCTRRSRKRTLYSSKA